MTRDDARTFVDALPVGKRKQCREAGVILQHTKEDAFLAITHEGLKLFSGTAEQTVLWLARRSLGEGGFGRRGFGEGIES